MNPVMITFKETLSKDYFHIQFLHKTQDQK